MTSLRTLAAIACVLAVTGCAAPMPTMQLADNQQQQQAVPSGKSRVVFMRSSFVGSVINATVYDVTKGEPIFIGILPNASKLVYDVEPGEYTFMVVSEAADFMKAKVSAGRTYYSVVTPRMGVMIARFSFAPVRGDGATSSTDAGRIKEMRASTKLLVNTNETRDWYQKNSADIKAKQAEYWKGWLQKPAADMAEATLNPNDGM